MINASNLVKIILFADDTTIIHSHENLDILIETLNFELEKLNEWFMCNKLSLNFSKTNYMLFSNLRTKTTPINITINNYRRRHTIIRFIMRDNTKMSSNESFMLTRRYAIFIKIFQFALHKSCWFPVIIVSIFSDRAFMGGGIRAIDNLTPVQIFS